MHDKELKRSLSQGEEAGVEALIERYYPEILRYCLWHVPDRSLAEDAAQETFLKVIRYWDRYTHRGKFRSFLYRVAANTCVDLYRREGERTLSLEEVAQEPVCQDPQLAQVELRQLVRSLPQELQEVVLLRFGQDLSLREIGQVTDLPLRTVQSRLRAALKRLKQEFTEGGQR